jgi:hypothetical protein
LFKFTIIAGTSQKPLLVVLTIQVAMPAAFIATVLTWLESAKIFIVAAILETIVTALVVAIIT